MVCDNCGRVFGGRADDVTLTRKAPEAQVTAKSSRTYSQGTTEFGQDSSLTIYIQDVAKPIILQPAARIVLGRADTDYRERPDADLTRYEALEKGVSRLHAVIERHEDTLTIMDLGSTNGTYVNGRRLAPDEPRILRDGDEIRLGLLIGYCYFK